MHDSMYIFWECPLPSNKKVKLKCGSPTKHVTILVVTFFGRVTSPILYIYYAYKHV